MLIGAVIVNRNGPGADVDVRPNLGIANVGQVIHLAAIGDRALLDFDEISDFYVVGKRCAWAQAGKRAYFAVIAGRCAFHVAV